MSIWSRTVEIFPQVWEFLRQSPTWIQVLVIAWTVVTILGAGTVLRFGGAIAPTPAAQTGAQVEESVDGLKPPASWPETGDPGIDRVHERLNGLGSTSTDVEIIDALSRLFGRSGFAGIREEEPASFLFALFRIRVLLDYYLPWLRVSPIVRDNLRSAQTSVIKLQEHVAGLYGVAFADSVQSHSSRFQRIDDFRNSLPMLHTDRRDQDYVAAGNATIHELKEHLKNAGMAGH